MEWQPIETAPKDGTLILVGTGELQDPKDLWLSWWYDYRGEQKWAEKPPELSEPTHWKRIPSAEELLEILKVGLSPSIN